MHDAAVGQLPDTWHPFVDGVVGPEVLAYPVFTKLPPVVSLGEKNPDIVLWAAADYQGIALDAARLIDQGRGGRPVGIVKYGSV